MDTLRNQKQTNSERLKQIDERWGVVEEAFRIENKERKQDLSSLTSKLHERLSLSDTLQKNKAKAISQNINNLQEQTNTIKQNINGFFDYQAQFRVAHLEKKNNFIQNYNQSGENFNANIQNYGNSKLNQISNRLDAVDKVNREKTEEITKQIKQEHIKTTIQFMANEKEKYKQLLGKMNNDVNSQLEGMKHKMKQHLKRKDQADSKLKFMLANLTAQLTKLFETQSKEGESTYDCLLKLIEDSCSRIQQVQLK